MHDENGLEAFIEELRGALGERSVKTGEDVSDDYSHDEALTAEWRRPLAVAFPSTTEQVSAIARIASRHEIPIVPRGSGTGLSGGAVPVSDSLVVSFEEMNEIIEIDEANHVAVVQPGVTLAALDQALAEAGFVYPVFPGELGSSLGGNVATNAGGMRAVKYGVTRHQVLGLEFVLAGGEIMRSGGKYVKSSSGYDLVQLILGSEGTLALVTEVTIRIYPRPGFSATMLVPFSSLASISNAVPELLGTGVTPLVLEYMDAVGLSAMSARVGFELGVGDAIKSAAKAYLFVILEANSQSMLDSEAETFSELLLELGALEVFLLNESSAAKLLEAREGAFWVSKALGANDLVDVVVPRAEMPACSGT